MTSIAAQFGFTAAILWNLPENAQLKQKRTDLNVLYPGDTVYVSDLRPRIVDGATDQLHRFVKKKSTAMVRLRLTDDGEPRAGVPYSLTVEGVWYSGDTGGDGLIEHPVPPEAREGTLTVGEGATQDVYQLKFGTVDPVDTEDGVKGRLLDLGYGVEDLPEAIRSFQQKEGLDSTGEIDPATRARLKDVFGQ